MYLVLPSCLTSSSTSVSLPLSQSHGSFLCFHLTWIYKQHPRQMTTLFFKISFGVVQDSEKLLSPKFIPINFSFLVFWESWFFCLRLACKCWSAWRIGSNLTLFICADLPRGHHQWQRIRLTFLENRHSLLQISYFLPFFIEVKLIYNII